ncbi:hypothetical protein J2W17_003924 [Pseudomonas lini]|uniref:leucine-rich repeat domain-containing protein n=1 Tax=Pseudomonas lini TaxID=163011 RepID=UPI00277FCF4A|nr:leucine-rich repeat domain-containing protein [Pseudomonas lini]MDQ0124968.1 hypothetical protein [Pseudomonas lini]
MSPKPPTRGNGSADVHIHPNQPSDVSTPRPDIAPRIDFGSPTLRPDGNPARPGRTNGDPDLDAITPAPVVTVHETIGTMTSVAPLTPVNQSLERYRLSTATGLPDVNADGLRIHKGRRYVDLADGGVALVGTDPETGLYRARLPSELTASGPVLLRDPHSGRWHKLEDFEPITFPLTDTRLAAFRTGLDFSDAEPGSDGLHRFDGKLYVEIDNHAYQVLHDLDASTPLAAVMRIVRSEDPVAIDNRNRYVPTRPGRSEPIVFDAVQGWVGTGVAGAGGMMRGDADQPARPGLLDRLSSAFSRLRGAESRARKLFPDHTDDQISDFIRSLGDDVRGRLTRRETEYNTLKAELKSWIKQSTTSSAFGTAKDSTLRVAEEIKRCWRQQTGSTLRLALGNEPLPALKADFSHVRALELDAVTWSDSANTFLSGFSGLERLAVTRSTLDNLPAAVAEMSNLSTLDLSSNLIQLNEQTAAKLSTLSKLQNIDLSGNPLGKTPDFAGLSELETLNLNNAQLDQWPTGLQNQTRLKRLDLRNNRLREVPAAILDPSADPFKAYARINSVTLLEGNSFPAGYWKKLEAYWQRVAADHPELNTNALTGAFRLDGDRPEIAMVQRLYPDKNTQEARAFFIGLGDEAEAKLARRAQDLDLLESQLDRGITPRPDISQKSAMANVT